jgi:hypothetical protein
VTVLREQPMQQPAIPKNGLLSGMIITQAAAVIAIVSGLFVPGVDRLFAAAPSKPLLDVLLASVVLMTAHKIESYFTGEFDQCPVYLTVGRGWEQNVRRAGFTVFVTAFLGGMFLLSLGLRGPPWPLLLMSIWCAQGLHELHHTAKSLVRRRYYPGTVTGILFTVMIDVAFFPLWYRSLPIASDAPLIAFYACQPLVLLAFYLEDRRWFAAYSRVSATATAGAGGGAVRT